MKRPDYKFRRTVDGRRCITDEANQAVMEWFGASIALSFIHQRLRELNDAARVDPRWS